MTREAKIGMLTGLFVIVLIGVLLSEYLGGAVTNNRMAALPQMGENYRRQMVDPVGAPEVARTDTGTEIPKAYAADREGSHGPASTLGTPVAASDPGMGATSTSAMMVQSVKPVPAGPVVIEAGKPAIPTIETVDGTKGQSAVYVAVGDTGPSLGTSVGPDSALVADKSGTVMPVLKAAPKGEEHMIVKGDTLQKIAKAYYKSAAKDDVRRIIAANPASLKDETSTLVVGKKLLIPAAPGAVAVTKADPPVVIKAPGADLKKPADVAKRDTVVVIHPPGVGNKIDTTKKDIPATPDVSKADKKPDSPANVYIVQKGDTLEKIAKKISATAYKSVMDKIVTLNGMKDKDELQVGEKLKVPSKKV